MKMVKSQILAWLTLLRKVGKGGIVTMEGQNTYRFAFDYGCIGKKEVEFFLRRLARRENSCKAPSFIFSNESSRSDYERSSNQCFSGQNGDGGKVVLWSDINNIDSTTSVQVISILMVELMEEMVGWSETSGKS